MKLCVFQGTFNPIHNAHINMALYVLKKYNIDKVMFIPAYIPPHKAIDEKMSIHRINMVKLAAEQYQEFCVSDIEYQNDRISYTYLTILDLYKLYKLDDKIIFLIGTDAFRNIETWYEADKLKELVKFLVFKRESVLDESVYNGLKLKGFDFEFVEKDFEDISSTKIRSNVMQGYDISMFVDKNVKEYIEKNGLYKN